MSQFNPPGPVLDIAARLEEAGFETWCVGGAVRDALLGHPDLDWDLATAARPDDVRKLFGARRTVPVGVEFGTVGVLDRNGRMHEVTTFRRDVKTDGRHAEVEFGVSLEDDLARRDFTINAIAYSPRLDEVRDPFDGRADLKRRVIRAVGDPDARMREDRLRALRAIRFASRFGFEIEPATLSAIRGSAPHLGRLSPERVKQELEKTMDQARTPAAALALWKSTGALATLIPSLAQIDDRHIAALDCLAMPGMSGRPQRRLNRLAMLFAGLPGDEVNRTLAALRFSRVDSSWVATVTDRFRTVAPDVENTLKAGTPVSDRMVREWVAAIGRLQIGAVMRLALALWSRGEGTEPAARGVGRVYRRMLHAAFNEPVEVRDLAVDGDDLRRAGIPAGPVMGKILHHLLALVLEDPGRNNTDWLLQEAARYHASPVGDGDGGGQARASSRS